MLTWDKAVELRDAEELARIIITERPDRRAHLLASLRDAELVRLTRKALADWRKDHGGHL